MPTTMIVAVVFVLFNLAKHNGSSIQNIINSNATRTYTLSYTYLFCWLARDFQLAYILWHEMNELRIWKRKKKYKTKQTLWVFFFILTRNLFVTHSLCITSTHTDTVANFFTTFISWTGNGILGCWLSPLLLQKQLFRIRNQQFVPLSNDVTSVHSCV